MNTKKLKLIVTSICVITFCLKSSAQIGFDTKYYDGGTLNTNEIGEQGVIDPSDNLYVAGEYNSTGTNTAIHIVKYPANGSAPLHVTYNYSGTNYNEKVVKLFWGSNNQLYVVIKALGASPLINSLLVLRYNSSLTLLNASPTSFGAFTIVDACMDAANNLYVAGITTNGSVSNSLQVMKLNAGLVQQSTYNFYYKNSTDSIVEEPKNIINIGTDIYIAGRAFDPYTSKSGTVLIKLNTSLQQQWKKAQTLNIYRNVYNSVAVYNGGVYVTGIKASNKSWYMDLYSSSTGALIISNSSPLSGYESEGLKITYAGAAGIYAAGYRKSTTLNQYKATIRKWDAGTLMGALNYYTETMPASAQINDAKSRIIGTTVNSYFTGTKPVSGGHSNMFFRIVNAPNTLYYSDSIVNHSCAGNNIVLRNGLSSNPQDFATVIGYQDKAVSAIQPHDYKFFTRIYYYPIHRLASNDLSNQSFFMLYPNPANDQITIKNSEVIKSWTLLDIQGRIVLKNENAHENFSNVIDISALPKGMYFITVNNQQSQKFIKE